MYFTKFILAAVGISFVITSPVPQDNNDDVENCNINCTDTAYICTKDASNSVDKAVWCVVQTIFKLAAPLLSAHLLVPCSVFDVCLADCSVDSGVDETGNLEGESAR